MTALNQDQPPTPAISAEISSARLLGAKGELVIIHNGERYTLRITANKKLILTK